jgi:hypothetical protein
MMKKMDKKGFEFSFAWLFSIVVGAVIIFLAIYAATKLVSTEREISEAETAKQLSVILSPIETGVEEGKISRISFTDETRLFNSCRTVGNFGAQGISTATKSGIGKEWQRQGTQITLYNKYIFSEEIVEGDEYEVLSKPFEMPFQVASVLFMWSNKEEYCFVDPPTSIRDEIKELGPRNINFTDLLEGCDEESKTVCFTISGCDVDVSLVTKSVMKNGEEIYYDDSFGDTLLYGAIFADAEVYECQLKRLMKRTSELSLIYREKSESLAGKGCSTGLEADLTSFAGEAAAFEDSSGISSIGNMAKIIGGKNERLSCRLF